MNKENKKIERSKNAKSDRSDNAKKATLAATSRFQNINDQHLKNITVYANGNPRVNFRFLLKSPRSQHLDYILDDVAVKISAKTGYAIRNLFAVSGEKIKEASEIRDGESYVAAGVEKFKRAAYGMSSATSQERPGRVRSRPLKPLKAPVKSQKETKEISSLTKTTKVQRKEALPPISVQPAQKEETDVVPDAPDVKIDLPIDQNSLPSNVSEIAIDSSEPVVDADAAATQTPDVVYSAPPGPLFIQDIEDEAAADKPSADNKNTLISSRSAPDGMEFELINPEDIPTVESTPEVPACAEEKFEKVYCSSASPEAIEPASNKEELDQAVEGNEHGGNEIERENLISANELTGESFTVAELREESDKSDVFEKQSIVIKEDNTVAEIASTPKIESPLVENQHVKKWIDEEAVMAAYGIVECNEQQILAPATGLTDQELTDIDSLPEETLEKEEDETGVESEHFELRDHVEASVEEVSAELEDLKKEVETVVDRTEQYKSRFLAYYFQLAKIYSCKDLLSNVIDQVQELDSPAREAATESELTASIDVMKDIEYVSRTDSLSTEGPDEAEEDERSLNDIEDAESQVMDISVDQIDESAADETKPADECDFVVEKAVGEDILCRLSSSSTEGPDEADSSLNDDDVSEHSLPYEHAKSQETTCEIETMKSVVSDHEPEAEDVCIKNEVINVPQLEATVEFEKQLPVCENQQENKPVLANEDVSEKYAESYEEIKNAKDIDEIAGHATEEIVENRDDLEQIGSIPKVPVCPEEKFENVQCLITASEEIESVTNKEDLEQALEESVNVKDTDEIAVDKTEQDVEDDDVVEEIEVPNSYDENAQVIERNVEIVKDKVESSLIPDLPENTETEGIIEKENITVESTDVVTIIADHVPTVESILEVPASTKENIEIVHSLSASSESIESVLKKEELDLEEKNITIVSTDVDVIVADHVIDRIESVSDNDNEDCSTRTDDVNVDNQTAQTVEIGLEETKLKTFENSQVKDVFSKDEENIGDLGAQTSALVNSEPDVQLTSVMPINDPTSQELDNITSHDGSINAADFSSDDVTELEVDFVENTEFDNSSTDKNENIISSEEKIAADNSIAETIEANYVFDFDQNKSVKMEQDSPNVVEESDVSQETGQNEAVPTIPEPVCEDETYVDLDSEIKNDVDSKTCDHSENNEAQHISKAEVIKENLNIEEVTKTHIEDEPVEDSTCERFDIISALAATDPSEVKTEELQDQAEASEKNVATLENNDCQNQDQSLLSGKTNHEDIIFADTPAGVAIIDADVPSIPEMEIPTEEEISHLLSSSSRITTEETLDRRTDELIADEFSGDQVTFGSIDTNSEELFLSQSESITTGLSTIAESFESRLDSSLTPNQASGVDEQIVRIVPQDNKIPLFQQENDSAFGSTTEEPKIIVDLKNMEVVEISDSINEEEHIEKQEDVVNREAILTEPEAQQSDEHQILINASVDGKEQENIVPDDLAQENIAKEETIVAEIIITPAKSEPEQEEITQFLAKTVEDTEEMINNDSKERPEMTRATDNFEIEAKVEEIAKVVVEKVTTEAESEEMTESENIVEPVEKDEIIIAVKINEKTIEKDHDIDSLDSDVSDSENKIIEDGDNFKVSNESKNRTSQFDESSDDREESTSIVKHENTDTTAADSENHQLAEKNDSIIAEKEDEEIIIALKELVESAQPQSIDNVTVTNADAHSESSEKVECDLKDQAGYVEMEYTCTNQQEKIKEIIAEKITESVIVDELVQETGEEILAENSSSVGPSEKYEDISETAVEAPTESENEQTIIIAEPIRENVESSQIIQLSQSEQDLSQAASDLSEINCFKNPMLASSSIEDDLSSEAVANIILESQKKEEANKSEEREDEFFSVESTSAVQELAQLEPELERSGPRKNSCQLKRVPVLISSRSVDTALEEDELDADDNVIMKTILEGCMTKSEPIVPVLVSDEPCEKFVMTSTSIEIEKSTNATNATSESIASITESDSLERVRSETIAFDTEAPEQIQTFTELEQQVTEEVKEEIAEIRTTAFESQEAALELDDEQDIKVDESADVNSLVGELVNNAVQKVQKEENNIVDETEQPEPIPVLPQIDQKPVVSEDRAEEIPAVEIEPGDRIEIVSSSAEIEDKESPVKLSNQNSEEKTAIEEAVKSLSLSTPSEMEDKTQVEDDVKEVETAIESDEKEDASSIPMTIIPDPEEKSAIEEAVKTLRSDPEGQAVQKELYVAEENKVDSTIATTVIADQEEKSAIEEAVKTLKADSEVATPKVEEKTDEKLPEEAELAKEAISSAVSAINKESVSEPAEFKPKDDESKVEESYQGSDPKEVEGSIIKESIKEGVAALNKTDDSGVVQIEEVEASEVELPAPEAESHAEPKQDDKKKAETSVLQDEGISDHFTSEKAAAPSGEL
ncbi:unnamed protein product [Oikopleura dioica]|uniref:Doublecortin domain-containing protein n=1 Tax=Oikopleura dioica TaxID=34765 RepID=E4XLG0_OIKDI|nr:unnamed protein product [Oikopleura dioica]